MCTYIMRLGLGFFSSCKLIRSLMLTVHYGYIKTVTLYGGLSILRLPIAAALGVSQYVITCLFLISQFPLNQAGFASQLCCREGSLVIKASGKEKHTEPQLHSHALLRVPQVKLQGNPRISESPGLDHPRSSSPTIHLPPIFPH